MLSRLKSAIEAMRQPTPEEAPLSAEPARLACAALLARAAGLDGQLDQGEDDAMLRLMVERFSMDEASARAVLDEAADDLDTSNDIYRYTKVLRESFDDAERIDLMEMLWEVCYADGVLHAFEAQLMRRMAGLMFVDDRDSGAARKRSLVKLGLAG
ncbi:MAG: TerB family tellurite resistance protein [Alphaproteobacteria bacterium]|nr:TerB family tellurite resistance protein [Alphaproteobacteria bacterium]